MEKGKLLSKITYEQYAAHPGLRASDLKTIKRSPAHFQAAKANPKESSEALEFGKVFHAMIENGEDFLGSYIVEPIFIGKTKDGKDSTRSKDAQDKKAAWHADLKPGAVVVKQDWVDDLIGMFRSIKKHRLVGSLMKDGVRETSLWVDHPATGITLKCRPDFIAAAGFLVDFKSTRDASSRVFESHIFDDEGYFYSLQMYHYLKCLQLAGICKKESATIIAVEKEAPWGINIFTLDVGNLGPAAQWWDHLVALYAECQRTGEWPGYPEGAIQVLTPQWVKLPPNDQT